MSDPNDDDQERLTGRVLTALAASALAVLAVLALVGVLVLVFGQRSGSGTETSARVTETPADPGLTPRPATPSPGSQTPRSTTGPAATGTAAVPTPSDNKVVVLNSTSRQGLAARFQQTLEAKGWDVVAVGNFRGSIPTTTVYYPLGQQAAAEALEAQFTEVDRVRPAFSGISQTRLTVILARE